MNREEIVPMMDRSIGVERTIQPKEYQPLKMNTYIKDIPLEMWMDDTFIMNLWTLLLVQVYRMFAIEQSLRQELRTTDDPAQYLEELEAEISEQLNLTGVVINYSMDMTFPDDIDKEEVE